MAEISESSGIEHGGSRLIPRAIAAGTLVALAVSVLLTFLAGGFGLTALGAFTAQELTGRVVGLGVWVGIAWIVAASAGGYVAALAAGSTRRRDGCCTGS